MTEPGTTDLAEALPPTLTITVIVEIPPEVSNGPTRCMGKALVTLDQLRGQYDPEAIIVSHIDQLAAPLAYRVTNALGGAR